MNFQVPNYGGGVDFTTQTSCGARRAISIGAMSICFVPNIQTTTNYDSLWIFFSSSKGVKVFDVLFFACSLRSFVAEIKSRFSIFFPFFCVKYEKSLIIRSRKNLFPIFFSCLGESKSKWKESKLFSLLSVLISSQFSYRGSRYS